MHRNQVSSFSTKLASVLETVPFNILGTLVLASELYNLIWLWWCFSWNITIQVAPGIVTSTDQSHSFNITALLLWKRSEKGLFYANACFPKPNQTLLLPKYNNNLTRPVLFTFQVEENLLLFGFGTSMCKSNPSLTVPLHWALSSFRLVFVFLSGMGPMPWTINSEIYPLWARSTGNACAAGVNWTFNFLVSLTFLHLAQYFTYYGQFLHWKFFLTNQLPSELLFSTFLETK